MTLGSYTFHRHFVMSTLLTCTLVQWLQVYNARAAEFMAELLGGTQPDSVARKCLTLVTPAGIYVRTIHIDETTTVAVIVTFGEQLYTVGDYTSPLHHTLCLWDHVKDGDQLTLTTRAFKGMKGSQYHLSSEFITCVSWYPNGSRMACGTFSGMIYIRNMPSFEGVGTLRCDDTAISSLCWHPSGKWLACGSTDYILRIWDIETWKSVCVNISTSAWGIFSVSWHSSGKWLISTSGKTITFWEISTWTSVKTIECPSYTWGHIRWHPTANQFASAIGNMIRIWTAEPLQNIHVLSGHIRPVTSICWHPSGNWLAASGSTTKTIRIWNIDGGNTPQIIENDIRVQSIDWNLDGTKLVSAGDDAIQIWK